MNHARIQNVLSEGAELYFDSVSFLVDEGREDPNHTKGGRFAVHPKTQVLSIEATRTESDLHSHESGVLPLPTPKYCSTCCVPSSKSSIGLV